MWPDKISEEDMPGLSAPITLKLQGLLMWGGVILALSGCTPNFQDDVCTSDTDCFSDEACVAGSCVYRGTSVPLIVGFTVAPATIQAGESATLSWELEDVSGAQITAPGGFEHTIVTDALRQGTLMVSPQQTTTYTLTAASLGQQVTREVTLTVEAVQAQAPVIDSFQATPSSVAPGDTSTLSWTSSGATSGEITYGETRLTLEAGQLDSGSVEVSPEVTTSYTLTLTNAEGESSRAVTVTVMGDAPVIDSFSASAPVVAAGEEVTLSWEITGADSITLTNTQADMIDVSALDPSSDSITLTPTMSTVYTLRATNASGEVSATASVSVMGELSIVSFTATPDQGQAGDVYTLAWTIDGEPTSISITDDSGNTIDTSGVPMITAGSVTVLPSQTVTYTLSATDGEQTQTATATVTITPDPPVIVSFTSSAPDVAVGGTITLSWQTTGATSIALSDAQGNMIDVSALDVAVDDVEVTVTQATSYTLTASNAGGDVTQSVDVTTGVPVVITSFNATPDEAVAGDLVTLDWVTSDASSLTITASNGEVIDLSGKDLDADAITVTPTAPSTTYTLTAQGYNGPVTSEITLNVTPRATITTFDATPPSAVTGDTVTLSWATSDATGLTLEETDSAGTRAIDISALNIAADSLTRAPTEDTTYTLTATGPGMGNSAIQSVTVTVSAPVAITAFDSDEDEVLAGELVTLSWTTTGATDLTLTSSDGTLIDVSALNPANDSVMVSPLDASTTYTLSADGPGGPVTETVTVTVLARVAIVSFTATSSITAGDSAMIAWQTTDAVSLTLSATDTSGTRTIDISALGVDADGLLDSPTLDTTYTLTATGAGAGNVETATASVTVMAPPVMVAITSFTASAPTINEGDMVTLSWATTDATGLTLEETDSAGTRAIDISALNIAADSLTRAPTEDTTYTLTAAGPSGPVVETVSVTVTPASADVAINSFVSDETNTISGQAAQLSWSIVGATSFTLSDGTTTLADDSDASATDTFVVRPQVTTTYTLTAQGNNGPATATVTITVGAAPLLITELFLNPSSTDDSYEWVELYNSGDTFVDLAEYSLGHGGTDYLFSRVNMQGILPPKGCALIGGPLADPARNFVMNPADYFYAIRFNQNFQNGGSTADGVGLFFTRNVVAASVPIDAVLYGSGPNTNNLRGEDGLPKTDISPNMPDGGSLERVSAASDIFVVQSNPTPGRCLNAQAPTVAVSPNDASGQITFDAFGLDLDLVRVDLGSQQDLTCTQGADESFTCDVSSTSDAGAVALTFTQTHSYTADADGDAVLTPLPAASQKVQSLADAFFWEAREDAPALGFYCGIWEQSPAPSAVVNTAINIEAQIYVAGSTEGGGSIPAGWVVEAAYFTPNAIPYTVFGDGGWQVAGKVSNDDNDAIHAAALTSSDAGSFEVAFRVSRDGGTTYIYCDRSGSPLGSSNGWNVGGGQAVSWTAP